jgi:hypothetical protein
MCCELEEEAEQEVMGRGVRVVRAELGEGEEEGGFMLVI